MVGILGNTGIKPCREAASRLNELLDLKGFGMYKHEVRSPEQALAYITDCTLATVADMAMRKSRPKHEYERQKAIAQQAITWMDNMRIDYSGTRASEVREAGSVDAWADRFEV